MKYKVGDRVKIKSLDWYNENKDENGDVNDFISIMSRYCGESLTIYATDDDSYYMEETHINFAWTDEMIEGLVEELLDKEMEEHQRMCDEIMDIQGIEPIEAEMEQVIHCPEGYIFKDENGNVINAMKIVLEKKKPKYPQRYADACEVLGIKDISQAHLSFVTDNGEKVTASTNYHIKSLILLNCLLKLKVCRDAYWKIAGYEMGLGKPWKPSKDKMVYSFYRHSNEIETNIFSDESVNLEFPTAEMRDAFYENYKELIESCKELL